MQTDASSHFFAYVLSPLISAAAGLLGVSIGAWATARNERRQRLDDHVREQLQNFYAPMLAMRKEIRAKSEIRQKVHNLTHASWDASISASWGPDVIDAASILESKKQRYGKVFDYSDEQLRNELVPLYERMLTHFTDHMWLAEASTLKHLGDLVEYVEVWKRSLAGTLPFDVADAINHSEEKLYPFYEDLNQHFQALQRKLKE